MGHSFFAYLFKLKYIKRWSLMRNFSEENVKEHSFDVAAVAHNLALIAKRRLHEDVDPLKAMAIALYHETGEVITGDLPTPIKYFDEDVTHAFKRVESIATRKIYDMLSDDVKEDYTELIFPEDSRERQIVKEADKICAYIKCREEIRSGNKEFILAEKRIKQDLINMGKKEVDIFLEDYMDSFDLTLDELNR